MSDIETETEVVKPEKPAMGRVRKRTAAELLNRVRQLEEQAEKREGWEVQVRLDGLPAEAQEIASAPNDTEALVMFGMSGSAPAMTERYIILKGPNSGSEGDTSAVLKDMRAFVHLQYQMAEKSAALAERALNALDKTTASCTKMAKAATRATVKQFRARKEAIKAKEDNEGFLGGILKEVGAILGPDKSEKLLMMGVSWINSKVNDKPKRKAKPKPRRKVKPKPRRKVKPKVKP